MRILSYVITGCIAALAVVFLLPRKYALFLGITALFLGTVVPIGLWTFAYFFVSGDTSTTGMLGTICVILFAPAGVLISILAYFKNE